MAKKGFFKTLKAFSFAGAILLAGCSNMGDASSFYDGQRFEADGTNGGPSGGQASAQVSDCLTARVSLPSLPTLSGNAPVPKNIANNISKSAFPDIKDAKPADNYSFEATLESSGGTVYEAVGRYTPSTATCDFDFAGAKNATLQTYTLTVKLYHTDISATPAVKSLVASGSQSVTVAADANSFDSSVSLAPNLGTATDPAPNGSLELPIKFSDTSVTSVQLKLLDSGDNDKTTDYLDGLSGTDLPLSSGEGTIQSKTSGLPAGTYTLLMTFMKGTAQVGARTESLNVYPTMQTKLWWTKDGIGTATTTLNVTKFDQKEFYVRGTGGVFYTTVFPTAAEAEDTNNGSFAFPLKTIQAAVNRIQAAGDTTSQYTIIVDGKVTGAADADYSAQNDAYINIACDRMITVKGWSGADKDIIDANKSASASNPARALYIESSKKIVLQKIAVTGGYLSGTLASTTDGGGIFIAGATTEVELDNCVIQKNDAQTRGGGIYLSNGGSLAMKGSSSLIKSNRLLSNVSSHSLDTKACGGGVYVGQGATFTMNAGTIRENVLPITTSGGGGIYVLGTFDMKGGTVSSNGLRKAADSYDLAAVKNIEVCSQGTFNLYDGTITKDIDATDYESCAGVILYASMNQDYPEGKATFNMSGGTICGLLSQGGGGVRMNAYGTDYSCEFNMSGGTISGNTATYAGSYSYSGRGGGVYVGTNSVFNFTGGTISGNTATYAGDDSGLGGGIYIAPSSGSSLAAGQCYISGSALIGQDPAATSSAATSANGSHSNSAQYGGGIYNNGKLYLGYTDGSTPAAWTGSVCYNYASSDGGGILSSGSSSFVKMNAGSVAYNLCSDGSGTTGGGGGVAAQDGSGFAMSGGKVTCNQTNNKVGGGIYIDGGGTLALSGDAEVSSNKTSPDGTGSMGGAGLFAYRASITMEGNAVVKDNLCKACGGGVYLFEFEDASGYASLAMSGNAKILENTSSDGLGGAVYVTQRCLFSMQGATAIPAGVGGVTGAGKNDVYLDENTSVAVPAALTSTEMPVATIRPIYTPDAVVLTGAALDADECGKFAVIKPEDTDYPWTIEYDSTKGGVLKHERNVIYVADYGDNTNGDGTEEHPFETINFAATKFSDPTPAGVSGFGAEFKNKIYVLTNMAYTVGLGASNKCYYEIVGCKDGVLNDNVTFTFNTPSDSGLYVAYGQKIKLTHIDITQSSDTANNYAAILVEKTSGSEGELWMEDCSIKNMYANGCSAIAAKGNVHLKNVEITGNKTIPDTTGGVSRLVASAVHSTTGAVSILGKVLINNNKMQVAADGSTPAHEVEMNVWMGEKIDETTTNFNPIVVDGLITDSKIGVTLFDNTQVFTSYFGSKAGSGADPADYFTSDEGWTVVAVGSGATTQAKLQAPTTLYVKAGGSDLVGTGTALNPYATIQKAIDRINDLDKSSAAYTIQVVNSLSALQHASADNTLKAASLTIKGGTTTAPTISGGTNASGDAILELLGVTATINIQNLAFSVAKKSSAGGAAINASSCSTVNITNCKFGTCTVTASTGTGGAIYWDGGTLNLSNTDITSCSAPEGGAIYINSGVVNMASGTISGNTASSGSGGGVSIASGGTFIMSGGTISGNGANLNGGGICNEGITCLYDGAIIGKDDAGGTAESTTKCSNKAGYNGGGICNEGKLALGYKAWASDADAPVEADKQALNKGVYYNHANNGGGIYNSNSGTVYIASGNVSMNKASLSSTGSGGDGGGVCNYGAGATLHLQGGSIDSNSANNGGGIYNKGVAFVNGDAKIGTEGKPNKAEKATTGGTVVGGGIYNAASGKLGLGASAYSGTMFFVAEWTGSVSYNTARDGGGGVCNAGTMSMPYGTIDHNSAPMGGGLYTATSVYLTGGTISYNEATTGGGGGVFAGGGTFTLSGGTITQNTAKTLGGGIDVVGGTLSILSGTISSNKANCGAGVYLDNSSGSVLTSSMSGGTISQNTGVVDEGKGSFGGGVFIGKNTKFAMSKGTVEENTADCGGAVYIGYAEVPEGSGTFVYGYLDLKADAYLPGGTDNKNDIQISNSITVSDALNKTNVATISSVYNNSGLYTAGTVVLEPAPSSTLPTGCNTQFTVKPDASTKTWGIDESGILVELHSGSGTISIDTPQGKLTLTASTTKITSNTSDTTITITGTTTPSGGTLSGWSIKAYYNGTDLLGTSTNNTYKILKSYPNGYYSLVVNVTYNGVTYSDTFTIQKAVP